MKRRAIEEHHRARLALLKQFERRHGLDQLHWDTVYRGVRLGVWAHVRRQDRRLGKLAPWLVRALDDMPGWHWSPRRAGPEWKLAVLREFLAKRGWEGLAPRAPSPLHRGLNLREWLEQCRSARQGGRLAQWLAAELEAIPGFTWTPRQARVLAKVGLLRTWLRDHAFRSVESGGGPCPIVDGVDLRAQIGEWRRSYRNNTLPAEVAAELRALPGWRWSSPRGHYSGESTPLQRRRVGLLMQHVCAHGWVAFRGGQAGSVVVDGQPISRFVSDCRQLHREGRLSPWLTSALEAVPGWRWNEARVAAHERYLGQLTDLVRVFARGSRQGVPSEVVTLALFALTARSDRARRRKSRLSDDVARALEAIPGWRW